MMNGLFHRGNDAFGISTGNELAISEDLSSLASRNLDSTVAIGYNLMKVLSIDVPQPCRISDGAFSLDGEIYSERSVDGAEKIARNTRDPDFCERLVESENGAYAISAIVGGQIRLARDPLGLKPLYYGENADFYAAASERKALWNVGVSSAIFFPPGNVATITSKDLILNPTKTIQSPTVTLPSNGHTTSRIYEVLLSSIRARTSDTVDVAVAFSGGLDSGLVSFLAKSLDRNVQLITVGMKNSHDLARAQETSQELSIPITSRVYERDELERAVRQTIWYIEDTNPMKVEVAVAMGWAASVAAEEGFKVMLTGQGGDELFAGYARFARIYALRGPEAAKQAATKSVLEAHMTNHSRDEQVTSPYRARVRHPFADFELAHLALSLPIESNITAPNDRLRKRILRGTARQAGMPRSVIEAPKRAVQYGSGIHKALMKIAKKRNLSIKVFVEKVHDGLSWDTPPAS
jgi:asparagine synthase (glutamine-hydrolysing)